MGAGSPPGPPLEAPFREVIEHGDPLRVAHRMVHTRAEVEDARAEVDPLGGAGEVRHHHLARRQVAVLRQGVVLREPGVLPVGAVGEHHELDLSQERLVLAVGVVRGGPRDVPLEEQAELHHGLLTLAVRDKNAF